MRFLFLFVITLLISTLSIACDMCNCYLGLDPGYNKNTIGILCSWRSAQWVPTVSSTLRSAHTNHNSGEHSNSSKLIENFINTGVFIKYAPVSKVRLYATIPYVINTLSYEGVTESRNSISDLTLLAMYQVINTMSTDSLRTRHRFFAGGGVKFPTGKSEGASEVDIPMSHHLYSGTGSTDLIISLSYIGKCKKTGWSIDASYKLNGESKNDYRYGHTLNVTPNLFYEINCKSIKLFPHLGAAYEQCMDDEWNDVTMKETNGETLFASGGVDLYFGTKVSLTTDLRLPVYHDMGAMKSEDKSVLFTSLNFHF